jgi:hypothetical protein
VAVRYFLDRPCYGLHNSAVRLWFNPPGPRCTCQQVRTFLVEHQIVVPGLLVKVYLDQLSAFMMLDACEMPTLNGTLAGRMRGIIIVVYSIFSSPTLSKTATRNKKSATQAGYKSCRHGEHWHRRNTTRKPTTNRSWVRVCW